MNKPKLVVPNPGDIKECGPCPTVIAFMTIESTGTDLPVEIYPDRSGDVALIGVGERERYGVKYPRLLGARIAPNSQDDALVYHKKGGSRCLEAQKRAAVATEAPKKTFDASKFFSKEEPVVSEPLLSRKTFDRLAVPRIVAPSALEAKAEELLKAGKTEEEIVQSFTQFKSEIEKRQASRYGFTTWKEFQKALLQQLD